jgi:hypothetical protein
MSANGSAGRIGVLSLLLACGAVRIQAQDTTATQPPSRFLRVLYVYDSATQAPIVGAKVVDLVTGNSVLSSATGNVGLAPTFVKATGAMLEIRKLGYAPVGPMLVDPLIRTPVGIAMSRAVVQLPTVTTTANYNLNRDAGTRAGYETRCATKLPTCISGDSVANYPSRGLGDFVRFASGVRNASGLMTATLGRACMPTFFVDGMLWPSPPLGNPLAGPGAGDPSPFTTQNIAGIEVYPDGQPRPLRFQGDKLPPCGAIVIWTKVK